VGDDILEIYIANDRLRVTGAFGDRKTVVHIQVCGDQTVGNRVVDVEHADVLGGEHDLADGTTG